MFPPVKHLLTFSFLLFSIYQPALADDEQSNAKRLDEVEVTAEAENNLFLPDVVGTNIFAGKKTTVASIEDLPPVPTNNYRVLLHSLPGVLVSEVPNESLASLNYRGIGDPHESYNLLVLKDGIPIQADLYGYPAAYYQPPAGQIDKIELIRGGGSLLYGPQPGAVLNLITRQPEFDTPLSFQTNQTFGEKRLYSTYNEISGGDDTSAGMGFYHNRQFDGYRAENSDVLINNGGVKAAFKLTEDTVIRMDFDAYQSRSGEAGGLALDSAPGVIGFNDNRWQNTVNSDQLEIERYAATMHLESNLSADSRLEAQLWGGQYRRQSRRQDLGGAQPFGGIPFANTNTIQTQEFHTLGSNIKFAQKYLLEEDQQIFTTGIFLYGADSPFRQETGETPDSNTGYLTRLFDRHDASVSPYAENEFKFGDFKLVPGVRVENIYQTIDEKVNRVAFNDTSPLREDSKWVTQPLFGLGAGYEATKKTEVYANISQSYKPVTYQDFVPLGPGDTISSDIDPAHAYTIEVGYRGKAGHSLDFDVSLFRTDYDNQFGRVGPELQNVGAAIYQGLEFNGAVGILAAYAELTGAGRAENMSDFKFNFNANFLDASFTDGPLDGLTPQYAPKYLLRPGISYERPDSFRVAFMGTFQDSVYADDGNSPAFYIPSFEVFDLIGDITLADQARINFGVNNLFDEKYYSRIRGNGIDPAPPRNVYAGFTIMF